jgi:hypothetical protein
MQTTFLKVFGATVIAATTVQMAGAAEHHARKAHATAIQQFRNSNAQLRDSNAYAPPGPSDLAAQAYRSSLDEGAMSSGMAGH